VAVCNLLLLKKNHKTYAHQSFCFLWVSTVFVDPVYSLQGSNCSLVDELFFAGFLGTLVTDGKIPSAGDVLPMYMSVSSPQLIIWRFTTGRSYTFASQQDLQSVNVVVW
jgi:hypothetical protein